MKIKKNIINYNHNLSIISNSLVIFSCYYDKRFRSLRMIGIIKRKINISCYFLYKNNKMKCNYTYIIFRKDSSGNNFKSLYVNILLNVRHLDLIPSKILINNATIDVFTVNAEQNRNVLCITTLKKFVSYKLLFKSLRICFLYGITDVFLYVSDKKFDLNKIKYIKDITIHIIRIYNEIYMHDSFYFGQIVKYNDCLYRNMYNSNYIIFTDFDETVLLNNINNYQKLFNIYNKGDIFYFRSALCPTTNYIEKKYFHLLNDTDISNTYYCCLMDSFYHRKYIIKSPIKFIKINIHNIDYSYEKYEEINVNDSFGHIHHSRIPTFLLMNHCKKWFYDEPLNNMLSKIS